MDDLYIKAKLLEKGCIKLSGIEGDTPKAGPMVGRKGIFIRIGSHRVKLEIDNDAELEGRLKGDTIQIFHKGELLVEGLVEQPVFHAPRQAYIVVSESCIFDCIYCDIGKEKKRKSPDEIYAMVDRVKNEIEAISITSGVLSSPQEEVTYVASVIKRLTKFDLPIGVSIYPSRNSSLILKANGAQEIKYNIEIFDRRLFEKYCRGKNYDLIISSLENAVNVFGEGKVFSNIIVGLGESEDSIFEGIDYLTGIGVIPVLRPFSPGKKVVKGASRPKAEQLIKLKEYLHRALARENLLKKGKTMCHACGGCDLLPF
jgi:biotin synthase-related radical SAM superfamily protein